MSTQLQNKLWHYAPEPPQKVWETIASLLDEKTEAGFPKKLYDFEASPSPQTWDKIKARLEAPSPAKVVPFFQKHKKLIQYAAAAAIVILLAVTTTLLTENKPGSARTATTPATVQNRQRNIDSKASPDQRTTPKSNSLLASARPDTDYQKNAEEKKSPYSKLQPQTKLGAIISRLTFMPKVAEAKQTVSSDIPFEKYMVYSDGDGNAMKLPKKLFDFITCVKEDMLCKQEMEQLQQKVASAVLTTDFTGVLEVLKNLKENQ
jgi:hypothetical protein